MRSTAPTQPSSGKASVPGRLARAGWDGSARTSRLDVHERAEAGDGLPWCMSDSGAMSRMPRFCFMTRTPPPERLHERRVGDVELLPVRGADERRSSRRAARDR